MKYILTDSVKHLKIPSVKVEKSFFLEGELRVRIKEDLKGEEVIIISNITTENILEFLFIVDATKRMRAKIKRIIIPFLSYARQDRLYTRGESVSGAVICSILKSLKVPIVIFDVHSLRLRKYLKFENISLLPILIDELPKKDWVVISPDKGGVERAKKIAKTLGAPLLTIKKVRNNHINMWLDKELPREDVLIVDDMISSGTTILKAVKILKKKGAKNIYCISTHGLFIGEARNKLLKSGIKKIFVTNSLPIKSSKQIRVKKIEKFFR
ncbi:MAG: ribose-phosphate diphosphokinase [archaeon]